MQTVEQQTVIVQVTVHNSLTVLPRILQVLSRRSMQLVSLTTEPIDETTATLHLVVLSPSKWKPILAGLLLKLVDVRSVEIVQKETPHA